MHIEPGYLAAGKIALANVAVVGVGAKYVNELISKPALIGKSLLAAIFFSLFMQILPVCNDGS